MSHPNLHGKIEFTPPARLMKILAIVGILGVLVFLGGLILAPHRIWVGYLVAFNYLVGLGMAGGIFLAVATLSGATWANGLRRIPEAMTSSIPLAALLGLGLLFGLHALYEWTHESVVAGDKVLQGKSAYLNVLGFSIRLLVFFAIWIFFLRRLVRISRQTRNEEEPGGMRKGLVTSALFMIALAITFSLASFDWLMSLEAHWFSTAFALYRLAGVGLTGIAAVTIFAVGLRRTTSFRNIITGSHLQDLGRITLSLSVFWVYIWYCQHMLIWYTNMPEETSYYLLRNEAPWNVLTKANLVLNWLIPFLVLMPRAACRNETVMLRVAVAIMAGQALDLFLQVGPPLMGERPTFGIWEIIPLISALALFFLVTMKSLGTSSSVREENAARARGWSTTESPSP